MSPLTNHDQKTIRYEGRLSPAPDSVLAAPAPGPAVPAPASVAQAPALVVPAAASVVPAPTPVVPTPRQHHLMPWQCQHLPQWHGSWPSCASCCLGCTSIYPSGASCYLYKTIMCPFALTYGRITPSIQFFRIPCFKDLTNCINTPNDYKYGWILSAKHLYALTFET